MLHADNNRDELLLLELLEHLQYAYEDVRQFNNAEQLAISRRDRNSAAKEIEQAQECAGKLSVQTMDSLAQIPWKELRGIRNVIVHEYGEVDWDVLFDTVTVDFPPIIRLLQTVTHV